MRWGTTRRAERPRHVDSLTREDVRETTGLSRGLVASFFLSVIGSPAVAQSSPPDSAQAKKIVAAGSQGPIGNSAHATGLEPANLA